MTTKEILKLQKDLEELKSAKSRIGGKIDAIMDDLNSKFGTESEDQLKVLLKEKQEQLEKDKAELKTESDKFYKTWGKLIDEL